MAISFRSTFNDPSKREELVIFSMRFATILFKVSKGFSEFLDAVPALDVTALRGFIFEFDALEVEVFTRFPDLEGGRLACILFTISVSA